MLLYCFQSQTTHLFLNSNHYFEPSHPLHLPADQFYHLRQSLASAYSPSWNRTPKAYTITECTIIQLRTIKTLSVIIGINRLTLLTLSWSHSQTTHIWKMSYGERRTSKILLQRIKEILVANFSNFEHHIKSQACRTSLAKTDKVQHIHPASELSN